LLSIAVVGIDFQINDKNEVNELRVTNDEVGIKSH
jgi:hypothetical protein